MRINIIEQKLTNILKDYEFKIFSIKTKREFGENILEILLKGPNLNTDNLAEVHTKLFEVLEDGDLDDNYYLELSSVGAEYPLTSLEEIKNHIDVYVYVETNKFKDFGYILSVEDDVVTIEYNAKGQFRKIKIEYDTINKIRTSVKF